MNSTFSIAGSQTRRSYCKNTVFGEDELVRGHAGAFSPIEGSNTLSYTPPVSRALIPALILTLTSALVIFVARYTDKNLQQVNQLSLNLFVKKHQQGQVV